MKPSNLPLPMALRVKVLYFPDLSCCFPRCLLPNIQRLIEHLKTNAGITVYAVRRAGLEFDNLDHQIVFI